MISLACCCTCPLQQVGLGPGGGGLEAGGHHVHLLGVRLGRVGQRLRVMKKETSLCTAVIYDG